MEPSCLPNLSCLPVELLDNIFRHLDTPPQSQTQFIHVPNVSTPFFRGSLGEAVQDSTNYWPFQRRGDLKTISTICRHLRHAVLPRLFKHATLDPIDQSAFLEFAHTANLTHQIYSVYSVLHEPNYKYYHPAWWCRLHNEIRPRVFTIACAPEAYSDMSGLPIELTDAWAFRMPYQLLELTQPDTVKHTDIHFINGRPLPSILGAKPWTSIRVNEGSNLAAYTKYEYFLKKPPSLFATVQATCNTEEWDILDANLSIPKPIYFTIRDMLEHLRTFSFIAVFPFYNHVDLILKCIRRMNRLEKLFIKLCPEPGSTVLDEEINAAEGHFDVNDPWNELVFQSYC